ncbi:outer membrane protein assembly factor BamB family protein [Niallia nealsonii]|uniref:Pyrrolo-quinoline quinone repeat domain-containing protein n=1 Tax=Niallia nealsonii TaxID=115979 RepID=A0A2N0Z761_9BACI|nr:PQQ-binding-like beta-propeller repeat protein [Niallia nealsonii]PKG25324.1 hypothetical protein CWS01_02270 [Niallia nealsonii]
MNEQEGKKIRKKSLKLRRYLFVYLGMAALFFMVLFGSAETATAATKKFYQGKGYKAGLYDAYGDQPTSLNWNRLSPYTGSFAPALKWTYKTGDAVSASPVIGKDGTIYIGSEDSYLYAIKSDGKLKWKYKTKSSISASAAIAYDGTIYVTSGTTLYAITSTGKMKWSYSIPTERSSQLWLNSPPAIGSDGTVYAGVSGFFEDGANSVAKGKLLAIKDGKLKWSYTASSIDATPSIGANGYIYFTDVFYGSTGNNAFISGNVYALDANGKKKWKYEIGSYTSSSVLIGENGTVYVGSEDENFYAINQRTGKVIWKTKLNGDITGTAAMTTSGILYIGTAEGSFYAIDSKGKIKWQYKAAEGITSSPLIDAKGVIYFGSKDNYLYALASNGTLKWKASTSGAITSSPSISQKGDIYIGSEDGRVYAYNPSGKKTYSLSGKVLDRKTKKVVANAEVYIAGFKTKTDSKGGFQVKGIPTSSYVVTMKKQGYYTYTSDNYSIKGNLSNKNFYMDPGGTLTASPTAGVAHTTIRVSGKGLPIDESGEVFIDANKNKIRDDSEIYAWARTDKKGEFPSVSLLIPEQKIGNYDILYTSKSLEDDPDSVKPAIFALKTLKTTIKSSISSGEPHVTAKLNGSGFAAGERGKLYFDKNNNGKFEWEEPNQWVTMEKGSFKDISIQIPNTKTGKYSIRYQSDLGTLTVNPFTFTVTPTKAKMSINPTSGPAQTKVKVTGSLFVSGESGTVYFDANKNKKLDYSTDPYAYVQADSQGKFESSALSIPDKAEGNYNIYFQASSDSLDVQPSSFQITKTQAKMTLSPAKGVPYTKIKVQGTLFPPDVNGYIYFDLNKNEKYDYSNEPYTYITTTSSGTFQDAVLTAPSAQAGTYPIRFSASSGSISVPSAAFTLEKSNASLSISVDNAVPHDLITVKGQNFLPGDSGMIYYDINNNGKRDYDVDGETYQQYITINSKGEFTFFDFHVPDTGKAGTYKIRYQSNQGSLDVEPASLAISLTPAKIAASSTSVNRNSSITISGNSFPKNEYGYVYIDLNDNETRDYYPSEPYAYAQIDGNGIIPDLALQISAEMPLGTYSIRYDSSSSFGVLRVPPITVTIK